MYLAKTDATSVAAFFNVPEHGINWAEAAPGQRVVLLDAADFQTALDWRDAGNWGAGTAPQLVPDSENRNPGDPGYVDTYDSGDPPAWEPANNQIVLLADGSVELRDSAGLLQSTLTGEIVQEEGT